MDAKYLHLFSSIYLFVQQYTSISELLNCLTEDIDILNNYLFLNKAGRHVDHSSYSPLLETICHYTKV